MTGNKVDGCIGSKMSSPPEEMEVGSGGVEDDGSSQQEASAVNSMVLSQDASSQVTAMTQDPQDQSQPATQPLDMDSMSQGRHRHDYTGDAPVSGLPLHLAWILYLNGPPPSNSVFLKVL